MLIPLSRPGYYAELDDEDAHLVERHRWTVAPDGRRVYAFRSVRLPNGTQRNMQMHWCVVGQPLPGWQIDHIDGNGLNNRRANLRYVTAAQNSWNSRVRSNSASGLKGVMWDKCAKAWRGYIRAAGVNYRSPYFKNIDDAAAWVRVKRIELHGEYARHG